MSTTRVDLDRLANLINRTVEDPDPEHGYFVQGAYGRVRLMRAQGSVDVSPSLSKPELEQWMRAFHAGIIVGKQVEADGRDGLLQGPPVDSGFFIVGRDNLSQSSTEPPAAETET